MFSGYPGGILELKLRQLLKCQTLSEIILSTNDEKSIEVAKAIDPAGKQVRVMQRPEHLCLDTTPLQELINYVPTILNTSHIIWGHVTTPFTDSADYDKVIETYFQKLTDGNDSLITVMPYRNFLLRPEDGTIFNYNQTEGKWPRTQDLPLLYEVNHAMFITSRRIYLERGDRVGVNPYLYEQDKVRSFDIDWEEDFQIAEAIHDKLFRN